MQMQRLWSTIVLTQFLQMYPPCKGPFNSDGNFYDGHLFYPMIITFKGNPLVPIYEMLLSSLHLFSSFKRMIYSDWVWFKCPLKLSIRGARHFFHPISHHKLLSMAVIIIHFWHLCCMTFNIQNLFSFFKEEEDQAWIVSATICWVMSWGNSTLPSFVWATTTKVTSIWNYDTIYPPEHKHSQRQKFPCHEITKVWLIVWHAVGYRLFSVQRNDRFK